MAMRAYSTNRPIGLGTWPSQHADKVVRVVRFDHLTWVEEIHHNSFGYVEFGEDVPKADLDEYELRIPCGEDDALERIVESLWRHVDDDERFEEVWGEALSEGYTEIELQWAFDAGCAEYGCR